MDEGRREGREGGREGVREGRRKRCGPEGWMKEEGREGEGGRREGEGGKEEEMWAGGMDEGRRKGERD